MRVKHIVVITLATVMLPGAFAATGETAQAATGVAEGSGGIALAFDGTTRTLLKTSNNALFRSSDGGQRWVPVELPPEARGQTIDSVAVSAGDKGVLYAGGRGVGILRSQDAGKSWSARNQGLPDQNVTALTTHAVEPETVYAYVKGSGIYRSEDGGLQWKLMDSGPRGGIERLVHSNMEGSMQTGWFFAASAGGVQRSMDCFCGWRDAGEVKRAVRAVAYSPVQTQNVFAATDDGLIFSPDGGQQWTPVATPAPALRALIVTSDGVLIAATADGTLFRSSDDAKTWERVDG